MNQTLVWGQTRKFQCSVFKWKIGWHWSISWLWVDCLMRCMFRSSLRSQFHLSYKRYCTVYVRGTFSHCMTLFKGFSCKSMTHFTNVQNIKAQFDKCCMKLRKKFKKLTNRFENCEKMCNLLIYYNIQYKNKNWVKRMITRNKKFCYGNGFGSSSDTGFYDSKTIF
jgi:hypothetical protein